MTFVKGSVPELTGVPFAIEGDAAAVRVARTVVRNLGGKPVAIRKQDKVAYHAFATMICPLLVSLLAASEKAAALAGMSAAESRRRMLPIIRQTLRNYEKLGPARAFSGPIVRGDVETIRAHLKALAKSPSAKKVICGTCPGCAGFAAHIAIAARLPICSARLFSAISASFSACSAVKSFYSVQINRHLHGFPAKSF